VEIYATGRLLSRNFEMGGYWCIIDDTRDILIGGYKDANWYELCLTAILESMKYAHFMDSPSVNIYTEYISFEKLTEYMENWEKNGWKKKDKEAGDIQGIDIIKSIKVFLEPTFTIKTKKYKEKIVYEYLHKEMNRKRFLRVKYKIQKPFNRKLSLMKLREVSL
jgi:ribonuclease HI